MKMVDYSKIDFITSMFQPEWWYYLYPTKDMRPGYEFMKGLVGHWIVRTDFNKVTGDKSHTNTPMFLEQVTPAHIYYRSYNVFTKPAKGEMIHISDWTWIDRNWEKVDQVWIEGNNLNGFREQKAV